MLQDTEKTMKQQEHYIVCKKLVDLMEEEEKGGESMGKKKVLKGFDDLRKTAYGGALAVKSTDLVRHANNVDALTGDVSGLAMLGVGGLSAKMTGRMVFPKNKRKKKCKRKRK